MAGPFATATEFCEFTGMPVPTDLARYQAHLEFASAMIRRYCDQELSVVAGTVETFQGAERDTLLLLERPVTAITALTVSGVAFTAYTFTRAGLVIQDNEGFWSSGATVTYTHGYTETEPEFAALRAVCIDIASRSIAMNKGGSSEAHGAELMESIGWAPQVFLTKDNKDALMDLGKVGVG